MDPFDRVYRRLASGQCRWERSQNPGRSSPFPPPQPEIFRESRTIFKGWSFPFRLLRNVTLGK